ncbi:MAG: hypothetical protein RMZ41_001800 [Nostoc sp. DedVER02]|uniref:hypothetical protein n=1 Tax=unclassified Nostoc TaxID=2593658 RepID=UPI002AD2C20D|nr:MULTISPECIES: hypothetical protein [unclassified Nostoc]MDZ7987107.1 hypothetical protein [Nostoc sp. DedVER02]MDZ8111023.1 hypothetical protein [Nostoc sp. DedVER01b]
MFKPQHLNRKLNLIIEHLPVVLEDLQRASSETQEAYRDEVFELMYQGQFPGELVSSSLVADKDVFYIPLSTGEFIFYEVTAPAKSSNPDSGFTYYSVHFVVPKAMVDNWERKTALNNTVKGVKTLTKPVMQFIAASKITFFLAGAITGIVKFFT